MEKKELRRTIGERAKQRRKSLKLPLQYVAGQMDVNKTTVQRYENGSIDNTKKLIVEGLADALHVSAAWLRGETEDMGADMSDSRDFKIESAMSRIMGDFPLDMKRKKAISQRICCFCSFMSTVCLTSLLPMRLKSMVRAGISMRQCQRSWDLNLNRSLTTSCFCGRLCVSSTARVKSATL